MKNENQCKKILAYMESHGSITPKEALVVADCMRLAARIADLRKRGHPIVTNIDSTGEKRFARYYLMNRRTGGENNGEKGV